MRASIFQNSYKYIVRIFALKFLTLFFMYISDSSLGHFSKVLLQCQILKLTNVCQINLINENIKYKHWCFQISKIVSKKNHFGILIYILSWKNLFEINFRLLRRNKKLRISKFLTNIWRDNYHSEFDVVKGLR